MRKLAQVEEAKALMNEAKDWSVWHWLMEKRRVRAAADRATEALGELEEAVKAEWAEDVRQAYRALNGPSSKNGKARNINPDLKVLLEKLKQAEDLAENARLDAEATFDAAERRLSARMAREGAEKAINSWELREKAIRKAEAVRRRE